MPSIDFLFGHHMTQELHQIPYSQYTKNKKNHCPTLKLERMNDVSNVSIPEMRVFDVVWMLCVLKELV